MAIIGLDATYLSIYGKGTSRYQHNLVKGLAKIDKKNYYYVFLNRENILPELPQQENFRYIRLQIPKRIIWDQFQLPFIVVKYKLGIYHSIIDTLPVVSKGKFVLFLFEIPDYRIEISSRSGRISLYSRLSYDYNKYFFRRSLKKAKIIIASSYSTKADLVQKYGIAENKIRVIYPAADERFCATNNVKDLAELRKKYNVETGYILHISSQDPRDNTPTVIRVYHKALRESSVFKKLIIYGDINPEGSGLNKLTAELGLRNNVVFVRRFIDRETERLAELYQAADVYIDPSLYEGFGFQVVEAMSCGIPVITSGVTSLPEIVADAGILVNPNDIDGLSSALIRVLTDSCIRNSMRHKSLERTKFFSWDKTARETLAIYDELLA